MWDCASLKGLGRKSEKECCPVKPAHLVEDYLLFDDTLCEFAQHDTAELEDPWQRATSWRYEFRHLNSWSGALEYGYWVTSAAALWLAEREVWPADVQGRRTCRSSQTVVQKILCIFCQISTFLKTFRLKIRPNKGEKSLNCLDSFVWYSTWNLHCNLTRKIISWTTAICWALSYRLTTCKISCSISTEVDPHISQN